MADRTGLGFVGPIATAVIAVVLASAPASIADAAEPQPPDKIAAMIAETYNVDVLRVREAKVSDRAAYAVTVMNPGGNANAAFQVNTLLVDAETGALIPTFQHGPSGYTLPGAESYDPGLEDVGRTMRRESLPE